MEVRHRVLIFLVLAVIEYIVDRARYTKCKHVGGEVFLLFHHMVSVYGYFGWLLFNPLYHLILCVLILTHWKLNNDRCELTIINNRLCGNDESVIFHDFFKMSNVFGIHPGYVVGVLMVYDIVWIYNNRKKLSWEPLTR